MVSPLISKALATAPVEISHAMTEVQPRRLISTVGGYNTAVHQREIDISTLIAW